VINQYMRKKVPGHVRNIHFTNIRVTGQSGEYLVQIEGADADHTVQNVTFSDVSIIGSPLTEDSKQVRVGKHTGNILFQTKR
jgi:hypothetical protein